jgi:hypothetical protein
MPTATIDFDEETAQTLQRLAEAQARSPADIIRAALAEYLRLAAQAPPSNPLPPGADAYRSGRTAGSQRLRRGMASLSHAAPGVLGRDETMDIREWLLGRLGEG